MGHRVIRIAEDWRERNRIHARQREGIGAAALRPSPRSIDPAGFQYRQCVIRAALIHKGCIGYTVIARLLPIPNDDVHIIAGII